MTCHIRSCHCHFEGTKYRQWKGKRERVSSKERQVKRITSEWRGFELLSDGKERTSRKKKAKILSIRANGGRSRWEPGKHRLRGMDQQVDSGKEEQLSYRKLEKERRSVNKLMPDSLSSPWNRWVHLSRAGEMTFQDQNLPKGPQKLWDRFLWMNRRRVLKRESSESDLTWLSLTNIGPPFMWAAMAVPFVSSCMLFTAFKRNRWPPF